MRKKDKDMHLFHLRFFSFSYIPDLKRTHSKTLGEGGIEASFQSNFKIPCLAFGSTDQILCEANLYGFKFLRYLLGNFIVKFIIIILVFLSEKKIKNTL